MLNRTGMLAVVVLIVGGFSLSALALSNSAVVADVTLVQDGIAASVIVTAEKPTIAARLASLELQYHIEEITGAILPIKTAVEAVKAKGVRILVGESAATRKLGLKSDDFNSQEYLIQVKRGTVILMGRDWLDTKANRAEVGLGIADSLNTRKKINYSVATSRDSAKSQITVELPGLMDEQGTCYATYDFLERFCGVRWYGPSPLNIVIPSQKTLTVPTVTIRRRPSLIHRYAPGGNWPILRTQWGSHHDIQKYLFLRRIRYGGERWGCNHSFSSYRDRFLVKNPNRPKLFERYEPDFFAVGYEQEGHWRHLCLTNPELVKQVVKDARDYFDGKGIKGHQFAIGDYFSIVPADSDHWCKCDKCQAILEKGKSRDVKYVFCTGAASDYVFGFINSVAKEVKKTHPDKYIAALAYASYSYVPTFELESNVAVAPCMQLCYGYTGVFKSDEKFYNEWIEENKRSGRRLHVWNYFHHPMERALMGGFKCFPCFMPDMISKWVKRYVRDGVRGYYLCGVPQQLDYYLYMQTAFNAETDYKVLIDEFFTLYFGNAAEPMKKFYFRISEINKEERTLGGSEKESWDQLGTKERMKELGTLMDRAIKLVSTDIEKRRVATWKKGLWDYMVEGRRQYVKQKYAKEEKEFAITVYNTGVDDDNRLLPDGAVDSHWRLVQGNDETWNGPETYTILPEKAPIPPWGKQTADSKSKWITPNSDGVDVLGGTYAYEQTFNIDERMDLDTASVFGRLMGDDLVECIEINGVKIPRSSSFSKWSDFLIIEYLVIGKNRLRIFVKNSGDSANPHGVRVELSAWANGK